MRYGTTFVSRPRLSLLAPAAPALLLMPLGACTDLPARDRPAPAHEVAITSTDFSYVLPDTVPAGLARIRLVNHGKEHHHAQIARVHPGHTVAELRDALAAGGPLPAWVTFVGGPGGPPPGGASEVHLLLEPGSHAVLCFVQSADGVSHLAKGMIREIKVVPGGSATQPEPRADARMVLKDYGFAVTPSIAAGRRTIKVENAGPQPHEVVFVRLQPGKTAGDVLAWLKGRNGPPPGEPWGGTVALQAGEVNYVTADFPSGEYALLCFVPDAGDGRRHTLHGMVSQITVS